MQPLRNLGIVDQCRARYTFISIKDAIEPNHSTIRTMTEQYTRPKLPNAPHVPDWVPPSPTKEDIDWAKLRTIDLSLLDSSDPVIVETLVQTCKAAIREDGFLYLTNYGIPLSEVMRQFSIAQYNYNHMSDEDKLRLKWDSDGGLFAGYKPPFGWKVSLNTARLTDFRHNQALVTASNTSTSIGRSLPSGKNVHQPVWPSLCRRSMHSAP